MAFYSSLGFCCFGYGVVGIRSTMIVWLLAGEIAVTLKTQRALSPVPVIYLIKV